MLAPVCGDGVVDPTCGEECDDGTFNGTPGSRCTIACTERPPALRIPGGGTPSIDCVLEWSLALALPSIGSKGLPKTLQTCVDDDPGCDFDPTPGNCRLHLWTCLGGADPRLACAAQAATTVEVSHPKPGGIGPGAAVRQALLGALGEFTFPVGPGEQCTNRVEVDVPVKGARFMVRTRVLIDTGAVDKDSLKVKCAVRR
jgi:hypothetical protein